MKKIILGILLLASMGTVEAQGVYDHQYRHWQSVLNAYTHQGRVNYKGLKANDSPLKASIQILESVSKAEFEAFTIKQEISF